MLNDKLIVFFYFPENLQAILNRHIPVVTRSLTKIMSHLDDLQSVADYLELLGKIHHQSGIQVREINKKIFQILWKSRCRMSWLIFHLS